MRIRVRTRDENDNENDGTKSNQGEVRLKIKYIARVGSDKSSQLEVQETMHVKSNSFFVIKVKQSIGEWTKFKFVAESLAERDTVVLAIRSLIEQARAQYEERARKTSSQDRFQTDRRHENRFEDARDDIDTEVSRSTKAYGNGVSRSRRMERKARLEDEDEAEIDSSKTSAALVERNSTSKSSSSSNLRINRDAILEDSLGCNPMNCQNQALAAVEDGELMNFAANELAGPWCTDDVCTAGIVGFADSMKGMFESEEARRRYPRGRRTKSDPVNDLLSVKDLWNIPATEQRRGRGLRKKIIVNRSRNADAKAQRYQSLRAQMTFHGANADKKLAFLQTTNSFDDVNRCGRQNRKYESYVLEIAGQLDTSAFLETNASDPVKTDEVEIVYYDSDPEDARERSLKRGPRRAMAERSNVVRGRSVIQREALDILGTSRFGLGRKWRRHGEEVVLDIIEATKNEQFTLMWHPTQTESSTKDMPAVVCVKLWVEHGVYLADGTFLLPKLTWLPVHEGNLHAKVLNTSGVTPGLLDLLDVCRVKEYETVNRKEYPFANPDRSFMIQTQTGKYVFETQSKQERGRVVNGLKLVIARLASLLMLRDLRAVDEFFGGNNSVPGEAPAWARTEKNESSRDFPNKT